MNSFLKFRSLFYFILFYFLAARSLLLCEGFLLFGEWGYPLVAGLGLLIVGAWASVVVARGSRAQAQYLWHLA